MRKRRQGGVSVGHDAFLDIVANLVGILIILVVVLGAQSQAIMREVQQTHEEPLDPESLAADEQQMEGLGRLAANAASAQADSIRLEKTIKHLDARIAKQSERRTILLTLLSEAEDAWEAEKQALDQAKREAAERNAEAARLNNTLDELAGAKSRLDDKRPEVIAVAHLPTPMAKTVFGEEIYWRLKGNRLSVIPIDELSKEIERNFLRTSSTLREGVSDAAVGPIRGYVARYILDRKDGLVSDGRKVARMSRARVLLGAFEPLEEPHGVPIREVLEGDDWLDVELHGQDPASTTVTVAVYPDSYGSFRMLREKIYAKGFATAATPIEEGKPIYVNYSGGGTRSAAQ